MQILQARELADDIARRLLEARQQEQERGNEHPNAQTFTMDHSTLRPRIFLVKVLEFIGATASANYPVPPQLQTNPPNEVPPLQPGIEEQLRLAVSKQARCSTGYTVIRTPRPCIRCKLGNLPKRLTSLCRISSSRPAGSYYCPAQVNKTTADGSAQPLYTTQAINFPVIWPQPDALLHNRTAITDGKPLEKDNVLPV